MERIQITRGNRILDYLETSRILLNKEEIV